MLIFLGLLQDIHGRKKESNLHNSQGERRRRRSQVGKQLSRPKPRWKFPELPTHAPHPHHRPSNTFLSPCRLLSLPGLNPVSLSLSLSTPVLSSLLQSAQIPSTTTASAGGASSGSVACGQRAARILISPSFDGDQRKVTRWELTSPPTSSRS
jgi:hypothetical protein